MTQYSLLAQTLLYVYRCDVMTQYSLLAETLLYVYKCDAMTQYSLLANAQISRENPPVQLELK